MSANLVENVKTCLNQLSVRKVYALSDTKYLLVIRCLKSKKKVLSNGNMFLQTRLPLIGEGGSFTHSPCWFSLNNLETVKGITLAFCSIQ